MLLSELVSYRNCLNSLSVVDSQQQIHGKLENILHAINDQSIYTSELFLTLIQDQKTIIQSLQNFELHLNDLKHSVQQQISEIEKEYFQQNYQWYENEKGKISDIDINIDDKTRQLLTNRVVRHSQWYHAGMIIHPRSENFIQHLVGAEPLYLVDEKYDLLDSVLQQFNEIYRNRLRPYTIIETDQDKIFKKLPDSQFGFVLAYNYFNYKPLEVIKQYLQEIYQKLKPGGTLIMTFNDCDNRNGVILVERNLAAYTPNGLIKQMIDNLGFILTFEYNNDSNSTWIELQKPGELISLRGAPTLAKIMPK